MAKEVWRGNEGEVDTHPPPWTRLFCNPKARSNSPYQLFEGKIFPIHGFCPKTLFLKLRHFTLLPVTEAPGCCTLLCLLTILQKMRKLERLVITCISDIINIICWSIAGNEVYLELFHINYETTLKNIVTESLLLQ